MFHRNYFTLLWFHIYVYCAKLNVLISYKKVDDNDVHAVKDDILIISNPLIEELRVREQLYMIL